MSWGIVDPKRLKRWLIVAAVAYLLFPRDLVPDFLGRGLGLVDDLALIAGLVWYYRHKLRDLAAGEADEPAGTGEGTRRDREEPRQGPGEQRGGPSGEPAGDAASDPHAVLGVPRSASAEEIRAAYRARMREYHPDKVEHLGPDLKQLAHRKTLEIQRAYEKLRR